VFWHLPLSFDQMRLVPLQLHLLSAWHTNPAVSLDHVCALSSGCQPPAHRRSSETVTNQHSITSQHCCRCHIKFTFIFSLHFVKQPWQSNIFLNHKRKFLGVSSVRDMWFDGLRGLEQQVTVAVVPC